MIKQKNKDISMAKHTYESEFIRTTIYIPRKLHDQAKIMAIVTNSTLSGLVKIALTKKLKELNEQVKK
jgi:hypothetical protein